MSSIKRKIQRQIQKNNGTLEHKKVIARKLGCTVKKYNKRMQRKANNLKEYKEDTKNGKE
jgi:hypothetical protein